MRRLGEEPGRRMRGLSGGPVALKKLTKTMPRGGAEGIRQGRICGALKPF